jgi:hypothetical protein
VQDRFLKRKPKTKKHRWYKLEAIGRRRKIHLSSIAYLWKAWFYFLVSKNEKKESFNTSF